ncbi:MAG: S24 family peptidase [bacterium]|nr:S24 family peptidase [bacterium]
MSIQSERILNTIKEKHISYGDLSKLTGIAKSALQRYATGETTKIPLDRIETISKVLNVSPAYILGWSDSPCDLPVEAIPYNPIIRQIPILGQIAAGLPIYAEQNIEGYTFTDLNGGSEYFALRIKGDSMTAAFIQDESIIIVRQQETVENGEIAVVMVNDENATVKRFKREGNIIMLSPQSYNPEHETQIYDLRTDSIRILGKVVKCIIDF